MLGAYRRVSGLENDLAEVITSDCRREETKQESERKLHASFVLLHDRSLFLELIFAAY